MSLMTPASALPLLDSRTEKLNKYFQKVIHGEQALRSSTDGHRFLESICCQPDPAQCIERLVGSSAGLTRLREAVRQDLGHQSISGPSSDLIRYIQHQSIEQLCNGRYLRDLIQLLTEPPTFWNALLKMQQEGTLELGSTQCFAWLLLNLLEYKGHQETSHQDTAQRIVQNESLTRSSSLEVRILGQKIKQCLLLLTSATAAHSCSDGTIAGGRHDNDFADFRKITILPTADELLSTEEPFMLRASVVHEVDKDLRAGVHLDNQFRLLRQDMLEELKREVQLLTSKEVRKSRGDVIHNLFLEGIDCGTETRSKKLGLVFQCLDDLPGLRKLDPVKRAKMLKTDKTILRHRSLGCLFSADELIAFATLDRDEQRLALKPSRIVLQFVNDGSLDRVLMAAKAGKQLRYLQVSTPVFAFEPILRGLQTKTTLQLASSLLQLDPTAMEDRSPIAPTHITQALEQSPNQDLQELLSLSKPVILDDSQAQSFVHGLKTKVSLIQGPPGRRLKPTS